MRAASGVRCPVWRGDHALEALRAHHPSRTSSIPIEPVDAAHRTSGIGHRTLLSGLLLSLLLQALLLHVLPAAERSAELDPGAIRAFAEQLCSIPKREMGQVGAELALALIEHRLTTAGITPLRVRTTISVAADHGSFLDVDGERIRLHPHQPNQAATAGTGGRALTGKLVFAGSGSLPELAGKTVTSNIVVLDGDTREAWTNLAGLGAAAVIIRQPERLDRYRLSAQSVRASIAFPRFVADDLGSQHDGHEATLQSTVAWEARPAWSLMATIAGTSPSRDAVILTAGYEANGAIDGLDPGATRAWNAGLLCEIATALVKSPPERTTIIVFNGGRGEMMRGLRQLTATLSLDRDSNGVLVQDQNRILVRRDEALAAATRARLVSEVLDRLSAARRAGGDAPPVTIGELRGVTRAAAASQTPPLSGDEQDKTVRLMEQVLANECSLRADALLDRLDAARLPYSHRRQLKLTEAEVTALKQRIESETPVYNAWRDLQQRLDNGEERISDEENRKIREILPLVQPLLAHHREVLDQRVQDWMSLAAARSWLGQVNPIHLVALDLSDGNSGFSSITSGFHVTWSNDLGWLHKALLKLAEQLHDRGIVTAYDPAPQQLQSDVGAYWPENYLHEAGVVGGLIPAVTFSTTNDSRLKLGTPQDTAADFRGDLFLKQCVGLLPLLRAYIDCPDIGNRPARRIDYFDRTIRVEARSIGSNDGRRAFAFPFSMVVLGNRPEMFGDVRTYETWWGDFQGEALVPFLPQNAAPSTNRGLPVFVYGFDDDGAITSVLASSGLQHASAGLEFAIQGAVRDCLALVFKAVPSQFYNAFDPRLLSVLPAVTPLAATRNAQPNFAHVESADGQAAIFSEPGIPLLITAAQGRIGNRLVLLGESTGKDGEFRGKAPGNLARPTALDVAEDMWTLDEQRLSLLRRNGIDSDSLVTLHSQAERSLANAKLAFSNGDVATASGEAQTSWAFTSRVYPSLLMTANDIVYGLVVLLAFAIPFALICERLFLSGNTIVKKVAGFAGFFLATFLFFFCFHPAFSLATTPMIIFLAFLIILMSSWVIAIIYRRFEQEMEGIRMSGLGMHQADVSRLGTLFATVALGISNMRRRPMRTWLTALTVVLMTFILLTFASFSPSIGTQRIDLDATSSYSGILLRMTGWSPLADRALERVRSEWHGRFTIHPLRWMQPSATIPKFPVNGPGGSSFVSGVLGCSADEPCGLARALVRGPLTPDSPRGFGENASAEKSGEKSSGKPSGPDWIFFPEEVLKRIGVPPGESMLFRGRMVRAGLIDGRALADIAVIGGEAPTPLALEALDQGQQQEQNRINALTADGSPTVETASYIHLGPNAVAVASEALVAQLGGSQTLRGMTLVPRDQQVDIERAAKDMAQQLALTLRVGDKGEAYLLTGVGRLAVSGLGAVLIPLILGGLIIFSTMLNSVAERGREIFIYASLGLAPIHVGALFLVEAGIYAVLGGLGGYMLAQLIVSILGLAASLGIGVQPDINYSSFTAVATILMVMMTVLLSALYPALVASRAANPGSSEFKLPRPDGDHMEIPFPFTVSRRDIRGLLAYLVRYFEVHTEASTGCFTSAEAGFQADEQRFAVVAKVWLAPFDLGISQRLTLIAVPTDVKAIYAVRISLELLSGQRSHWRRANSAFLKALRQQFLVWRTLTPQAMDEYRALGGDEEAKQRTRAVMAQSIATGDAPLHGLPTVHAGPALDPSAGADA